MYHPWLADLRRSLARCQPAVLVTVASADGSTPRDAGAKMVVTADGTSQTIGGGHLEWRAIDIARDMLRMSTGANDQQAGALPPFARRRLEKLSLGPSLGQCCGGAVTLAFERITETDRPWLDQLAQRLADGMTSVRQVSFGLNGRVGNDVGISTDASAVPAAAAAACVLWDGAGFDDNAATLTETLSAPPLQVVVLGAGHVGSALVRILQTLPCRVLWADERTEYPGTDAATQMPGIDVALVDTPETVIDQAPAGACFVVMTHSHALDQQLCERILRRGDYRYFGLIGSETKRVLFERRLAARGIDAAQLATMVCPIGVPGIADKAPEVIAVAVAAELLQVAERIRTAPLSPTRQNPARHAPRSRRDACARRHR